MANDRSSDSPIPFGVELLNLLHRILRAFYLQFGPRRGPGSLNSVPFGVVVFGAKGDAAKPQWVELLASELEGSPNAPHEFQFSGEARDLSLLPKAEILLVDRDVATAFFSTIGGYGVPSKHYVVGTSESEETADGSQGESFPVVSSPVRGGALAWLEQFS